MYAVVVRETGDREAIEGSAELLTANLLPRVRQAPGIVSAIPPPSMRAAFTSRVWPLIERAQAAGFETRTLEQIRDALLPRLMSGELSPSSDKAQGA